VVSSNVTPIYLLLSLADFFFPSVFGPSHLALCVPTVQGSLFFSDQCDVCPATTSSAFFIFHPFSSPTNPNFFWAFFCFSDKHFSSFLFPPLPPSFFLLSEELSRDEPVANLLTFVFFLAFVATSILSVLLVLFYMHGIFFYLPALFMLWMPHSLFVSVYTSHGVFSNSEECSPRPQKLLYLLESICTQTTAMMLPEIHWPRTSCLPQIVSK